MRCQCGRSNGCDVHSACVFGWISGSKEPRQIGLAPIICLAFCSTTRRTASLKGLSPMRDYFSCFGGMLTIDQHATFTEANFPSMHTVSDQHRKRGVDIVPKGHSLRFTRPYRSVMRCSNGKIHRQMRSSLQIYPVRLQ